MKPKEIVRRAILRDVLQHRGGLARTHGPTFFERDIVTLKEPPKRRCAKVLLMLLQEQGLKFLQGNIRFAYDGFQYEFALLLNTPRSVVTPLAFWLGVTLSLHQAAPAYSARNAYTEACRRLIA